MLEAVAGTTAGKPDVGHFRVAVDQEIAVGGVFVLADAGFDDGRVFEGGKAAGYIVSGPFGAFGADDARLGVGIDGLTVRVSRHFQTA